MSVDETGGHQVAPGIDLVVGLAFEPLFNGGDAAAVDADVMGAGDSGDGGVSYDKLHMSTSDWVVGRLGRLRDLGGLHARRRQQLSQHGVEAVGFHGATAVEAGCGSFPRR